MDTMYDVAIVGAGPAGLFAAMATCRAGCRAVLLEAMDRPGRKLSLTARGRGNVSHDLPLEEFLRRFGPAAAFLKPALHSLSLERLRQVLGACGISLETEADGRIFPAQRSAPELARTLVRTLVGLGVGIRCGLRVASLRPQGKGWNVACGVSGPIQSRCVILATGGMSYAGTGARGDGFRLAQALGHRIVAPYPGLVGLHCPGTGAAQGSSAPAHVTFEVEGKAVGKSTGEVLFTHRGLSGPAILDGSKFAIQALARGASPWICLDFLCGVTKDSADRLLQERMGRFPRQQVETLLRSWLPPKIAHFLACHAGVDPKVPVAHLPASGRLALAQVLTGLRLPVVGHDGWNRAMVTCGGVAREEVVARTLMSRRIPGLFFAGEVLDIDGPTGGFNVHAALATGWHAGNQAARWVHAARS